jgi:hypothetical protein
MCGGKWAVCGVQIWQGEETLFMENGIRVLWCADVARGIGSMWCADVERRIGILWCADVWRKIGSLLCTDMEKRIDTLYGKWNKGRVVCRCGRGNGQL